MRIIFVTYNVTKDFTNPQLWLQRIEAYTGVLESLAKHHSVISIEQINYEGVVDKNNVQYHFLFNEKGNSTISFSINKYLKKLLPDVIIVHGLGNPFQIMQLAAIINNNTRIIVQHHAEKPFNTYSFLQKMADKFIDAYMFTSFENAQEWIDRKIIKRKEKIWGIMEASSIFQPIDRKIALQHTGVTGNKAYLFVGRLDDNKDPVTLVKAFLQFAEQQPGNSLYMLYHTEELLSLLKEIVNSSGAKEAITFIGKVAHHEMLYWFNSVDFIISTSHYEGSGVAVCEGISCGCIPVVTNIPAFKKLTANGTCGLLYEKANTSSLLNALLKTTATDIQTERKKVLAQFYNELSFDVIARQINECIELLV